MAGDLRTVRAETATADATPKNLYTSPTALTKGFVVRVHAHEQATGDSRVFWGIATRSNITNVTTASSLTEAGPVGGQGWSIEIAEGTDTLEVNVTGEAAHTIDWVAFVEFFD